MNFQSLSHELTECDREPIHEIAAIQGFGALIGVDRNWRITHHSANAAKVLETQKRVKPGQDLALHFTHDALKVLDGALHRIVEDDRVERVFGLDLVGRAALFDCAIHSAGNTIIIEFEPHDESEFRDHLTTVPHIISQLSKAKNTDALCTQAAILVRKMLEYDRVMIYRFHNDDSGEVIAEDKRADLDPYLGLRYPSSDIPRQARSLF
ncbi:MAG: hybrid sensor histidine kinase/response regulator, partial [Pseudomonadota bacterium]